MQLVAQAWMTDVLRIGANVATPLALVGFAAGAALIAYLFMLRNRRQQLASVPEAKRAEVVKAFGNRYRLQARGSPEAMQKLILAEMERRFRLALHLIYVIAAIVVLCIGVYASAQFWKPPVPAPPMPTVTVGRSPLGNVQLTLQFDPSRIPADARLQAEVATDPSFQAIWDKQELLDWSGGRVTLELPPSPASMGHVRFHVLSAAGQHEKTGEAKSFSVGKAS